MHHLCIIAMHSVAHEIQHVKRTRACGGSTRGLDDGARAFCSKSKPLTLAYSSAVAFQKSVIPLSYLLGASADQKIWPGEHRRWSRRGCRIHPTKMDVLRI